MQGKYSLTAASKKIGVTPAWVNRVQRETGIGGVTGKKGHKVSFNDDTVEAFRRVKVLRLLNFNFEDIKELYELEKEVIKVEGALSSEYDLANISGYTVPLLLHFKEVSALGPFFVKDVNERTHNLLIQDKSIQTYIGYLNRIYTFAQEIMKRKGDFLIAVTDAKLLFKNIADKYPNLTE